MELPNDEEKLVVYYDAHYKYDSDKCWINEEASVCLACYLAKNRYIQKNAEDLKKWMIKKIDCNTAEGTVIVFSQDLVPDTVMERASPNVLIRRYLNKGGRIVWFGNFPFIYQGKRKTASHAEFGAEGIKNILGLEPILISQPEKNAIITCEGKSWYLRESWIGEAPVSEDKKIQSLAEIQPDWKESLLQVATKTEKEIPQIEFSASSIGKVGFVTIKNLIKGRKKLIHAWYMSFNGRKKPGFIRIWDMSIPHLNKSHKETIIQIAEKDLR